MGDPIRTTTSDIPDFSTYPASPNDHLLPEKDSGARLEDVARDIGSRLGEGAAALRQAKEQTYRRVQSIRESAQDLFSSLRGESKQAAQAGLNDLRIRSQEQLQRAKQFAQARPLVVIAAAGIAGLLLGAGARAWRESRG